MKDAIKLIEFRLKLLYKALLVKDLPASVVDNYESRVDELESLKEALENELHLS